MEEKKIDCENLESKRRLMGLDILKILSMFFIIIHHLSKHGGFYENTTGFTKVFIGILNALFLPSVNIFVYTSAYLIIKKRNVTVKRYFYLYAQIVFYSLLTLIVTYCLKRQTFNIIEVIKCFLPITYPVFWFCREYLILYIISPLLLKMVQNLNKKQYSIVVVAILSLILYCNVLKVSIVPFGRGFSFIWFIALFLLAGYQVGFGFNFKRYIFVVLFIVSTVLSYIKIYNYGLVVEYCNFVVAIQTISLFNCLYDIDIKNKLISNVIKYISTCTLGIYLIHDSSFFQSFIYDSVFKTYKYFNDKALFYFWMFVLIIFTAGLIVEIIRKYVIRFICYLKNIYEQQKKQNKQL